MVPWSLARIAAFNNSSRNVVGLWARGDYVQGSVNLKGMLQRCLNTERLRFLLAEADWTVAGPIQQDVISLLIWKVGLLNGHAVYLELGAATMRHFYAQTQLLSRQPWRWLAVSVDVERPNPVVEELWSGGKLEMGWRSSFSGAMEHLYSYHPVATRGANIVYLQGSLLDPREGDFADGVAQSFTAESAEEGRNVWSVLEERLAGRKLNVIFSDAVHSPGAVHFEHRMWRRHRLIPDLNLGTSEVAF